MKMFNKKTSNRGFTIIELLVTIAVLAILVLLGAPRLLSYTQKAELTRIQHDVKVMEQEMSSVLTTENDFNEWQNNGKDLSRVVMRKELYEKQGVAKSLDWEHLSAKWLRADKGVNQLVNKDNKLGVGGDLIELDDKYSTYKIIPKEYSSKINTKLKGTFYVNSLGKVYYEHDKSLGKAIENESLACVAPSTLGYEFEIFDELGTITGWNDNATHLVIPSSFKISHGDKEWCEPVRVIGTGAFQNRTFKRVTIPQSVEKIQDEAFQGGELIEVEVPHSVKVIGDNAFTNNPATGSGGSTGSGGNDGSGSSEGSNGSGGTGSRVIVKGSSDGRSISDSAFGGSDYTYSPVTDKDLDVITRIKTDSSGNKSVSIAGNIDGSYGGSSSGSSLSNKDKNYSNTVINIPEKIEINGEILPVTEVEKGAFQGSGLIDVIMPEGLLYVHDYAFAGNQLVRAVIPNSVIEVGNYAFAYNEIASEPTIGPINILESKFLGNFEDVDNEGNINEPVNNINLKDHIFIISSMGNHVIEDIGANPEQSEDNNDEDVNNPIGPREPIEGEIAIDSADKLAKIGAEYSLDGDYILTANIDLYKNENWVPIGSFTNSTNKSPFTGSFDGNGYNITGLTINRSTNYVGLFGYTERATISNVALEDINVTGGTFVGGLVGVVGSNSTIENSYATGSVEGTGNQVGGLVGRASSSTIENSYSTGSVTGAGSYSGGSYVGGLVGASQGSTISNSYATGSVTGSSRVGGKHVGGLVGLAENNTNISNSYATGSVKGNSNVGGLVGGLGGNISSSIIKNSYSIGSATGSENVGGLVGVLVGSVGTASNSYWDKDTTGQPGSIRGTGKTTKQMKQQTTYLDWDFDTVWEIDEGNDYPKLR